LEGRVVLLERDRDIVPPGSTQGFRVGNRDMGAVGLTSRVLQVPVRGRALGIPGRSQVQVGHIGLGLVNVPVSSVDLVDTETRVEVGIRGHGGSDPGSGDGVLGALGTGTVVERKLVVVSVSKELLSNDVGRVTLNGLVVKRSPVLDAIRLRWTDVTNNPDTLMSILGGLELGHEPLELTIGIVILGMSIEVKVHVITEIVVEGDDAETGLG